MSIEMASGFQNAASGATSAPRRRLPTFQLEPDACGIVADIGGTNARLMVVSASGEGDVQNYKVGDFASFDDLLKKYFEKFPAAQEASALSIGVAGNVQNHCVELTNVDWPQVSADALEVTFPQFSGNVSIAHDVVCVVNGIRALADEELVSVSGGSRAMGSGTFIVLAPGTGFGFGTFACDSVGGEGIIVPGEAGYNGGVRFPAGPLRDLTDTISDFGHEGHHCRDTLTGRGLALFYEAVCVRDGVKTYKALMDAAPVDKKAGKARLVPTPPEEVTRLAAEGNPQAREAFRQFFTLLGKETGARIANATANGGAYLAGGVIVRCYEAFSESDPAFWNELTETLRLNANGCGPGNYSDTVPIAVVLNEHVGLLGLQNTFRFSPPEIAAPLVSQDKQNTLG